MCCWARTYWGCTWKHRSQLSQHDVLTFVQQDWNMTITTVLHSPYTPGRPRAAPPGPRVERLARNSRPGPTRASENKSREPGPWWAAQLSTATRAPCRSRDSEQSRLRDGASQDGRWPGCSGLARPSPGWHPRQQCYGLLSLSTSRNNVIISPDPTQAIHSHITSLNPLWTL